MADFGDFGFLEDEGVSGFEEGHHGIGGDFAGEASADVAHFGGDEFEGF